MSTDGQWLLRIGRVPGSMDTWRWKLLYNRRGDLVMTSRETYPSAPAARAAAEFERDRIHEVTVQSP